jgi:crotonobetainyl-CoA:carnitine CoA-transferase CaiB-like acyl-CoA transferase
MPGKQVPLAGVRVLDASRVLAGPFCGQILGDLGAEVIKVERPGAGDETRGWGPPFVEVGGGILSSYYMSCNRNKRGITLDLANPEGIDLFRQLAARSDILLENFRADSAERLGLTPDALLAVNPRLIVCSISTFGRDGPWRDMPGYDFAIQAQSGLMSITGPPGGPPSKVGVAITDVVTGLYAAIAVLACLNARQASGHGYSIDLALLDCAVACQVNVAQAYLSSGSVAPRQGNAHLQIVPYQLFATADGWLVLAVGNDGQWQRFCDAAERPDLAADEHYLANADRVKRRAELVPLIEQILRQRTTAEWRTALAKMGVPHAPVWDYAELFNSEQAKSRGICVQVRDPKGRPVDLVSSPFRIGGADRPANRVPPGIGDDTDEVLSEVLGLHAERIRDLHSRNVI